MQFGTTKTSTPLDEDGSTITIVEAIHKGEVAKTTKHFRIKIKVADSQQEMSEYIKFTEELRSKRADGSLTIDREDRTSAPSFIIEFPKHDEDGSYFILKCWSEVV